MLKESAVGPSPWADRARLTGYWCHNPVVETLSHGTTRDRIDRDCALLAAVRRLDSFGNVRRSRLEIDGGVLRWIGDRTRCTVTLGDGGMTQVAHHESSVDGLTWTASMDVVLRKVG